MAQATATAGSGIIDRAIRAARLDRAVYEEVEADKSATAQAAVVVVAGAVASAVGLGVASATGALPPTGVARGGAVEIVFQAVGALISWAAYAYVAFIVGTTILKGPETHADWGQVARTLGFASAPKVLLILALIPILGALVTLVVGIWLLVTTVVAVRAALDVTTLRAVGVAVVAWLAFAIVNAAISAIV